MKKFDFSTKIYFEVIAETEEQAIEIAHNQLHLVIHRNKLLSTDDINLQLKHMSQPEIED